MVIGPWVMKNNLYSRRLWECNFSIQASKLFVEFFRTVMNHEGKGQRGDKQSQKEK